MTKRKKKPAGTGKQTPKTLREKTRKNLKEMEKSDTERKNRKKKLLIAALIGGAVLIAAGVVFAGVLAVRAFAPPVLGFRDVPAETEKAISGYAQKQTDSGGKKMEDHNHRSVASDSKTNQALQKNRYSDNRIRGRRGTARSFRENAFPNRSFAHAYGDP